MARSKKNEPVIDLYALERDFSSKGYGVICGVDEAGRGPLAGPVVAAAVILNPDCVIDGVNDSKKLSEKKREALYPVIMEQAKAYGIGVVSAEEVDTFNILQATFLAMRRAVDAMEIVPDLAMVDGNGDPSLRMPTVTVVQGDAHSASIAAASILAKVYRDRLMVELDQQYPQYQFAKHKGYPTKLHVQCILEHGVSAIHRKTFLKKLAVQHPEIFEANDGN